MIRLLLVVTLGGCFSKPGLSQRDASVDVDSGGSDGGGDAMCTQPSGGLTLEETASHQLVARFPNGTSITFADPGTRYPFPSAIEVGSSQILPAAGMGCTREDLVGIAAFPVYSIGGNQTPTMPNIHPLDEVVVGPAHIQLVSNWTYQHASACAAGNMHGNGRTTWSMFPNGRVVRYDYLQPADNGTFATDDSCSCVMNTPTFTITSFMAVASSMVSALTVAGANEDSTALPTQGNDVPNDPRGACFRTPAMARVAMRWDDSSENRHDSRIRLASPDEIAFVDDIVRGGIEPTISTADDFTLRTHLFFETDAMASCTELNNSLQAHATTPPILVDGAQTAQDGLGFYDDTIEGRTHSAATVVHAEFGRVEEGWALRIRFPGVRSITTSVASNWQHEGEGLFYIFFPAGLPNDAMITITPECAI